MADTDQIDRHGINLVGLKSAKIGLICREQATSDFGIDVHLETKNNGQATGRLIAGQVKSGASYFRKKTGNGWWHPISDKHKQLWLNHSLPVIVIICDLEKEVCYWEIVTPEKCLSTGKNWKLHIPNDNEFGSKNLQKLTDISSSIIASSDYTIASESDISIGGAKRISLDIVVHSQSKNLSKPILSSIARDALEHGKNCQYSRNSISAETHSGKKADVVWGYIYLREIDRATAGWVCRFQWICKNLDNTFRPPLMNGEIAGQDLVIDWNQNIELTRIIDSRRQSKADFLEKFDELMAKIPPLKNSLHQINLTYTQNTQTIEFSKTAIEFEESWDDSSSPPYECQKLFQSAAEILATIGNAGLIWQQTHIRNLNQTLNLSRSYSKDLDKLLLKIAVQRDEIR